VVIWIAFLTFIFVLLALDLGVFHRRAHVISVREALRWTLIWMATALAFAGFVYFGYEHHWQGLGLEPDPVERSEANPEGRLNDARSAVLKFLTGYVVELSLSADNVFVIAMLFGYFRIPRMYQHRVLFWGIIGALAMRGGMIAIGARLVAEFSWILSVFGGLLILTAVRMAFMGADSGDPGQNVVIRLMRRFLPVTNQFHGERFLVRARAAGAIHRAGWVLTPLAPALLMVETTDLVFAVDSIPAIFAITADPFLVFTSNVFAILGLRSLYFALAGALHLFRHLKYALALVLLTVGIKMLAHSWLERVLGPNFNLYLLATVVLILGIGVLVSLVELRWQSQIKATMRSIVRTLQEWAVPDRLISTILRAAKRRVLQRRPHATRHRAERSATTPDSRTWKPWRYLFRRGRNFVVLAVDHVVEYGDLVMYV
jgi:TerC family integral membrane protein